MVYKRYIKQNGKTFGPYYYSSHRKNGKVVSKYLPEYEEKKSNLFDVFALSFVFLLIMSMFLIMGMDYNQYDKDLRMVGNVIGEISDTNSSIYDFIVPCILLAFFFLILIFLGYSIKKKREKDRIKRLTEMSYFHGKEESQKMIQKLLHK